MGTEAERLARAGNYVLGVMDEAERQRAEHDLEVDDDFRNAVMRVAERMHMFDVPGPDGSKDGWETVAARLSSLPQMRATPVREALRETAASRPARQARTQGLNGRLLAATLGLALVFALGFVAGRFSGALLP